MGKRRRFMSNINFQVPLDPSVTVSSTEADELPLRQFKVVILVDADVGSGKPKLFEEEDGRIIWEQVTEELMNFVSDFEMEAEVDDTIESSEIDTLLVFIGGLDSGVVYQIAERAYLFFPQGMNSTEYEVLGHLSYWIKGAFGAHPDGKPQ